MTIIPTEGRASMAVYREGRTEAEFLADMWKRRDAAYSVTVAVGKWPYVQLAHQVTNVTPIRAKRGKIA